MGDVTYNNATIGLKNMSENGDLNIHFDNK